MITTSRLKYGLSPLQRRKEKRKAQSRLFGEILREDRAGDFRAKLLVDGGLGFGVEPAANLAQPFDHLID